MRCYLKLLIPTALLLTLFAACSGSQSSEDSNQITRNEKGQILTPTERTWAKDKIGKELSLQPNITDSLLQPMSIERFGQQLYVSDFSDMKIKKFSSDGEYLGSFGKKGRGPGEFQLPIDYDFRGDTLFVIDTRRRKFMLFDAKSTDFITSRDIKFHPYRMAMIDRNLILEVSMTENLFYLSDTELDVSHRFGQFIDDQKKNGISVTGNVMAVRDTGFVFSPAMASYLYYFDRQGNRTKTIRTPDRIPFKEPNVRKSGDRRFITAPESKVRTERLAMAGDKLYVFQSYTKDDEALPASFMDVYQLDSGRYLHSVKFSFSVRDAVFGDETLYLINSETAVVKAFEYAQ